jgi:hypothetical protein
VRSSTSSCITAVCILCVSVIASSDALAQQPDSPVTHSTAPSSLTVSKMVTDDELFMNVPFDTDKQTACSPEDQGVDWFGVKVRAPSQVVLPAKDAAHSALVIPLCGIYMINLAKAIRHPGRQVLIVTDDFSGQTYRGEIVDRDSNLLIPPPKSRRLRAEDYEHQAFGGYLNINVASYVALPLQPARYRVKVEWSGYESNEVSVAVVQRR